MPKKFNPNSKLGQVRMQEAQRQRQRQLSSTYTSATQQHASTSQNRTSTPGSEEGQTGSDRGQRSTERNRSPSKDRTGASLVAIVNAHLAMRKGLHGFTGTTLEPGPDPETGSYSRTLNDRTNAMLKREIRENAYKLHSCSQSEKYAIVKVYDSRPGILTRGGAMTVSWAQEERPDLYSEYVEAAFAYFTSLCNESVEGKARDLDDSNEAFVTVARRIYGEYVKEKKRKREERVAARR